MCYPTRVLMFELVLFTDGTVWMNSPVLVSEKQLQLKRLVGTLIQHRFGRECPKHSKPVMQMQHLFMLSLFTSSGLFLYLTFLPFVVQCFIWQTWGLYFKYNLHSGFFFSRTYIQIIQLSKWKREGKFKENSHAKFACILSGCYFPCKGNAHVALPCTRLEHLDYGINTLLKQLLSTVCKEFTLSNPPTPHTLYILF